MANPLDLPLNFANEKLPPVPEELITWLKGVYPDRMPDEDNMMKVKYLQGQVAVVKTLTSIYEEQRNVHE